MSSPRQVPVTSVVRAGLVGLLAFGLLSLGRLLNANYSGSYALCGKMVLAGGLGLVVFALYRTVRARLHSLWLVSLLTAFTCKITLQAQTDSALVSWVDLYTSQVDPLVGWFVLLSSVAMVALIGRAGMVMGVARQ